MKGGEALVEALEAFGVSHIFGLPGVHNLPIYDALNASGIRVITARGENAASFMAQGYARITWKPGVCLLSPGPGVTNALTGITEAYMNSTPMVVLAGGIKQSSVRRGAIHDVDHLAILKPITKWCGKVEGSGEICSLLSRAFIEASSGRRRPTFIEIPLDIQSSICEPEVFEVPETTPSSTDLGKASLVADALLKAERPIIIAGGGVLSAGATEELRAFSELLTVPVATTITAKEVVSDASPLSLGLLNDEVARRVVAEADVVLALGCRFAERSTSAWSLKIQGKLLQVDVDPSEIGRNYPAALGVVCDAKVFLAHLLGLVKGRRRAADEDSLRKIEGLKAQRNTRYKEKLASDARPLKPHRVMAELSKVLPKEAVVTCDSGNNAWWPMMFLESKENRHFLFPSGNVSMGFGFPAALGARCAAERVVCITGDGGFMMQLAELATSLQERLNVTVLVLNDGGFGAIRHYQRYNFDARYIGVDLQNPDFAKLAEAFSLRGIRVETPMELASALREAMNSRDTTVLDVRVDPEEVALPDWIIQSFGHRDAATPNPKLK